MTENHSELLLLPDGRILVHNLTPAMAALLKEFDRQDTEIALRASPGTAETSPSFPTNKPSPLTLKPLAISKAKAPQRPLKSSTSFRPCVSPSVSNI